MLPFNIELTKGWRDVTSEIGIENPPWTFARPSGKGAFQFSFGIYHGGAAPNPSAHALLLLLRDFADQSSDSGLTDVVTEEANIRLAGGSFRSKDNFVRAWYVSDGYNFGKATYTCVWGEQHMELRDCEQMIRTLEFSDKAA